MSDIPTSPTPFPDDLESAPIGDASDGELFENLYDELKVIANAHMRKENAPVTLQPTALVNEAYLKLMNSEKGVDWQNKKHFLCVAASVMRRVLIDSARSRNRQKRGGNIVKVELDDNDTAANGGMPDDDVLAVHEALTRFEQIAPKQAQLIVLRFFGGLTISEAADAISVSRTTAVNYWNFGRAWLHKELSR